MTRPDRAPQRAPADAAYAGRREGPRFDSEDASTVILLGALLVSWWPIVAALRMPPIRFAPLVAHVTGMLAGYGVLVLLALMSRAPLLERGIGADVLARWHARGGRIVIALILVHAAAAVDAWAEAKHQPIAPAAWQVLGLPGLLATTLGTAVLVTVGVASARHARRRLSYERWHALHLLTYLGIALTFLHQLAGPDLAGHRLLQVLWALLYAHVFALLFRHRFLAPLRQAARHRLHVAAVVSEASGVVSIELAGQHLDELGARPGQFFRWRFLTPDHWLTAHPFSLSAPPTDQRLRLTVKALGDGSTSIQHVAVGTWVAAEGPYGSMTADRRTRGDVVLIAGGVGITPMRALLETLPRAPGERVDLIYRARAPEQVIFREELETIAHERGALVHLLLGDARDCLAAPSLLRLVPHLPRADVFLCGPPALAAAVRQAVRALGLPDAFLHEERFGW